MGVTNAKLCMHLMLGHALEGPVPALHRSFLPLALAALHAVALRLNLLTTPLVSETSALCVVVMVLVGAFAHMAVFMVQELAVALNIWVFQVGARRPSEDVSSPVTAPSSTTSNTQQKQKGEQTHQTQEDTFKEIEARAQLRSTTGGLTGARMTRSASRKASAKRN
jgi:hypothetical protein